MAKGKSFLGAWAFIIGLILAVVFALISGTNAPVWAIFVLAVIGLIVGLINVSGKETNKFLIASIAFLLSFQALSALFTVMAAGWAAVGAFFGLLIVFIAPAAAIVAIKALFTLAKD